MSDERILRRTRSSPTRSRGVVAQSRRRRTSLFPFAFCVRVFRKNFIVPYSGGPNASATSPPPSSSSAFYGSSSSSAFFFRSRVKRERKGTTLPRDVSRPTYARVTKGLFGIYPVTYMSRKREKERKRERDRMRQKAKKKRKRSVSRTIAFGFRRELFILKQEDKFDSLL